MSGKGFNNLRLRAKGSGFGVKGLGFKVLGVRV